MEVARARACIVVYCSPHTAGGSNQFSDACGVEYVARAARYDETILYDACTRAIDAITAIRLDVAARLEAIQPTDAQPGTPDKLQVFQSRVSSGKAVFHDGDRKL
jgi:hypothetical protein